ncbi:MAG: hypothetical protein ACD_49C00029G0019 [uncultured bacterium (gcode 4)]|uniref:Endonuclease/exonuclease/phosphatase domain-containing protein n=1 Tax=uncultured bacterium (gcode 4) TaxID=1234023 RepID=K2AXU9_9BACT|nr:MAG: hypothetical protein ACD_49C00029G0019 [uncultured bacterium (gcode 4)]
MKNFKFAVFLVLFSLLTFGCNQTNGEEKISKVNTVENKSGFTYAQFNAFNFGESKVKSTIKMPNKSFEIPTIEAMARLLKDFDIISIQEVSTGPWGGKAVAKLLDSLNRLGAPWDYLLSDPTQGPGTERFVTIFRKDKFDGIHNKSALLSELDSGVNREPFHSVLKEKKTGKYVHIYSFHLQPKSKDPKSELQAIANGLDAFEKQNVIVSGDFNLGHKDTDVVFEKVFGLIHHFEEKTSLKTKVVKGNYKLKEYDNIYTSTDIKVMNRGVLDFVGIIGNLDEARKISDHLIPWIRFELK